MITDARLAADIASGAGALLLDIRTAGLGSADGRELGRRGDVAADAFILGKLSAERPGDAILSEESADDRSRLESSRVWIIDRSTVPRSTDCPGTRTGPCTSRCGNAVGGASRRQRSRNRRWAPCMPVTTTAMRCIPNNSRHDHGSSCPPAGRLPSSTPSRRRSAPRSPPWVRPERRRWRCSAETWTPTSTRAVSGNGTRPHPSASPRPRACTAHGSTEPRWTTTNPTRTCPTS